MKVLVCGGRGFGEVPAGCPPEAIRRYRDRAEREAFMLFETLHEIHLETPIEQVIHGDCKTGADRLAGLWARHMMIEERPFPADWKTHRNAAGPIRNQKMLDEGKPDLVVAFPGGKGTADMTRRASAAGVFIRFFGDF